MDSIRFTNECDETITVSLLSDGKIRIDHSELDEPGEFVELGFAFRGRPRLGAISTGQEHKYLNGQETAQVQCAIQKLRELWED